MWRLGEEMRRLVGEYVTSGCRCKRNIIFLIRIISNLSGLLSNDRVRFNESDHGRATMAVPANNRRAPITGFNSERRSSVDRALFDILLSDRKGLPDQLGTCRRHPESVRRCQSPRSAAPLQDTPRQYTTVPRPSGHLQENPRMCQTVSLTFEAPARDSRTVGDDAKTVWVPEDCLPDRRGTGRRLAHGARNIPDRHLQETPRRCKKFSKIVGATARDSQKDGDDAKTVLVPAGDSQTMPDGLRNRQETLRQSATMPKLSGHQPDTHRQSPRPVRHLQGLQYSLRRCRDRLGSCRRLPDSLRCCQVCLGTCN
ncbi:hypothetical protein DPMN_029217 [Dreissena polymorpha]|uniref:Uncharacterized protein n=1 Tax=Dreissena polymorpha TaxID=45954 RepID=A0A9D4RF24_DREPO|nr:hypothetical protein DPMN_029217 [Dreissena polymorpha]